MTYDRIGDDDDDDRAAVHSYADDTQLYASCSATDGSTSAAQLLHCITDIADWMTSNHLKLNSEKTQFMWLGSSYYTASVSCLPLSVGGSTVFPDDTVRNLGLMRSSPRETTSTTWYAAASSSFISYALFDDH